MISKLTNQVTRNLLEKNVILNEEKDLYEYYGASNYTLFPFKQLNSHSIENNAYLRIAGHTTSFSISAVV